MKLNVDLYAIIDPVSRVILGDGECPAIYSRKPDAEELERVRRISGMPVKVVKCRIVEVVE